MNTIFSHIIGISGYNLYIIPLKNVVIFLMFSPLNGFIQTFYYRLPYFPMTYPVPDDSKSITEDRDDPRLVHSPYQIQFNKNLEELKSEYQTVMPKTISYAALKEYLEFPHEKKKVIFLNR